MEDVEDPVLNSALQIDQYIAAGDQVLARERGVTHHIVIGEQYSIAQFALHTIVLTFSTEEVLQAFRTDIRFDRGGVESFSGMGNRAFIQVRSKDLDLGVDFALGRF